MIRRTLWLALLSLASLFAQEPAGVIRGSVRDAVTRAPVGGVELTLIGPTNITTTTEASGSFQFEKVPVGSFGLRITKAGYMDASHGRGTDRVRLDSANSTLSRTIDLVPLSEVEGRIVDEDGMPVAGVLVHGGTLSASGLLSTSDAEGRYHLENLAPGDYKITFRVPFDMRRKTVKRDPVSGETFGYAVMAYFPGVDDQSLSTPLSLAPGARLQNVEIRLRRTRLVSLSGRAIDTAGPGALGSGEVELVRQASAGTIDDTYRRRQVDSQGAFQFELIQPGRYLLSVFRGHEEDDLPFVLPVEVGNAGLEDLRVPVPPFQEIRGSVKFSDPKAGWAGSLGVVLAGVRGGGSSKPVAVSADGRFTLERVPPGTWRMVLRADDLHLAAPAEHKLHVATIRFGEQDALWGPITITESGNPPVEVTLSDESGSLAGTVTNGSQVAAGALIILRRAEAQMNLNQLMQPGMAKPDGSFLIPDLVPGNYEASAWIPDSSGSVALMQDRCGDKLAKVKIAAGETAILELRVCN